MFVGCLSLALTACNEPPSFLSPPPKEGSNVETAPRGAGKPNETDVEAPEVFKKTEKALWDGRPSLGGVWVAHPSNKKPERVIIRNETNGKFVIGALFGRESNLPGPPFQLSSDAAVALGVPAGSTLEITVTAMRTKKVEQKQPDAAPKAAPSDDIAKADKTAASTTDKPDEAVDAAAAPVAEAKPKTFKEKMAARKAARAAKKAAKVSANTAGDVAQTTLPAAANTPTAQATPTKQATPTASPLKKPISRAAPTPTATAGGKYVQLGLFSVEANAKATLAKVKAKGLQGKIVSSSAKGKTFHRVLAGPASSASEQARILKTVKSMGFADAYLVKG